MDNIRIERPEDRGVRTVTPSYDTPQKIDNDSMDLNQDGIISKKEEELYEKKAINRRRMAWVSLLAMIVSGFAIMFVIPESRLQKINSMLDLYWISLGGIVGAYVGISAWMSKR